MNQTYKITASEAKTTSTGKAYKKVKIINEQGESFDTSVWSDFPDFANLTIGSALVGELKKNDKGYLNLYPPRAATASTGPRRPNMERVMEKKEASIEDFTDKKELGIKISSTMRMAVDCAIAEYNKDGGKANTTHDLTDLILKWRKWLWENWSATDTDFSPFPSKPKPDMDVQFDNYPDGPKPDQIPW